MGNTYRDRRNLFKRFESADLTRLWRIYARSVDEKVKDWQGEHRANGGEKESKNGERRGKKELEEHDWKQGRREEEAEKERERKRGGRAEKRKEG